MIDALVVMVEWIELMEGCVGDLLIVRTRVRPSPGYAFTVLKSHR